MGRVLSRSADEAITFRRKQILRIRLLSKRLEALEKEDELGKGMRPEVVNVTRSKMTLLWGHLLREVGCGDFGVAEAFRHGVKLVGQATVTGADDPDLQLPTRCPGDPNRSRPSNSVTNPSRRGARPELHQAGRGRILEEASDKNWVSGPCPEAQQHTRFGQGEQVRVIDDFAASRVNAIFSKAGTPKLIALDEITAIANILHGQGGRPTVPYPGIGRPRNGGHNPPLVAQVMSARHHRAPVQCCCGSQPGWSVAMFLLATRWASGPRQQCTRSFVSFGGHF